MEQIDRESLERLNARLDVQEAELIALRATLVPIGGSPSPVVHTVATGVEEVTHPAPARVPSRRTLLKGAGALVFTTALLATGEVVSVAPVRVTAADPVTPPTRMSGTGIALAVTADTRYCTFVGTDFQEANSSQGHIALASGGAFPGGPMWQSSGAAGGANFIARVELPQGATITEVTFYVLRNDSNGMTVGLTKYPPNISSFSDIGSVAVTTNNGSVQTITPSSLTNTTVDNANFSYVLAWNPSTVGTTGSSTQMLFGARVGYQLPGNAQLFGHAQSGIGVSGVSDSAIGVEGQSDTAGGTGVKGVSASGFPIIGSVTGTGSATNAAAGVLGSGTKGPGVQGQSTSGHGLVGTTDDNAGHAGLIGNANNAGGVGLMGIAPGYNTMTVGKAGDFYGNVKINGGSLLAPVMQTSIKHPTDGSYRALPSIVAPEGWIEDFGTGTLAADKAEITLDHDFAALIESGYHVFLTAHGPQHLHVAQQNGSGFTVMAMAWATGAGGPKPTVGGGSFSWRVVGKRKDIAGERLAKVAAPGTPKVPTAFTIPETPAATPPDKKP